MCEGGYHIQGLSMPSSLAFETLPIRSVESFIWLLRLAIGPGARGHAGVQQLASGAAGTCVAGSDPDAISLGSECVALGDRTPRRGKEVL